MRRAKKTKNTRGKHLDGGAHIDQEGVAVHVGEQAEHVGLQRDPQELDAACRLVF